MKHTAINLPDNTKPQTPGQGYKIQIKENLSPGCLVVFEDFALTFTPDRETILTGAIADQSALHGLFARIRDLNLTIISVNPVEPKETKS